MVVVLAQKNHGKKVIQNVEKSQVDGTVEDLTRFAIQTKGPNSKWTRKPSAYRESNNVHLGVTRPPGICINLVFKIWRTK